MKINCIVLFVSIISSFNNWRHRSDQ